MSGGKGGGQSTKADIPEWAKAPTIRNLQRAEDVQQLGYMPYYGPDIAGFNPTQQASMQNNLDAAAAFGMAAPGDAMAGMPQATDYGNGMSGYSSAPLFEDAVAQFKEKEPEYAKKYDALFGNDSGAGNYNFPYHGEGGSMGMPNYNMGNPGNAGGFSFNGGRQSTMPDTRGGNFPQGPIDNELIAQNMDYNVDEMMMNLRKS